MRLCNPESTLLFQTMNYVWMMLFDQMSLISYSTLLNLKRNKLHIFCESRRFPPRHFPPAFSPCHLAWGKWQGGIWIRGKYPGERRMGEISREGMTGGNDRGKCPGEMSCSCICTVQRWNFNFCWRGCQIQHLFPLIRAGWSGSSRRKVGRNFKWRELLSVIWTILTNNQNLNTQWCRNLVNQIYKGES